MKRILLTLTAVATAFAGYAQSQNGERIPQARVSDDGMMPQKRSGYVTKTNGKEAVLYTEDFSGGIPTGWTNQGFLVDRVTGGQTPSALCGWEYRGPNTTPSNAQGSRGAFGGAAPLASPTASNGFMIFDSDFLDNGGVASGPGTGTCPAPHIGVLTTDTIDLTGSGTVELVISSSARQYSSFFTVAVSADGGTTFPDSVQFHTDLALNAGSDNAEMQFAKLPSYVNGENDVVLAFVFDGTPEVQTVNGAAHAYYYWMFDDMMIQDVPSNTLVFTDFRGAPPQDILYNDGGDGWGGRYGHFPVQQAVPISFDGNFFNYGTVDQTNVVYNVEILDANGTTVQTLSSATIPLVAINDTANFDTLSVTGSTKTTGTWTPSAAGDYDIVFSATSDSIPSSTSSRAPSDTVTIRITDQMHRNEIYSLDWGTRSNTVGTNTATNGILAFGVQLNFPQPNKDTTGVVFLEGLEVFFSTASDSTASLSVQVFDTTGFTLAGGFTSNPLFNRSYQLTAADLAANPASKFMEMTTQMQGVPEPCPLSLNANAGYYVVMNMTPNDPNGEVRIINDATFPQQGGSSIMFIGNSPPRWFSGFTNSSAFEAPLMRTHIASTESGSCPISLAENELGALNVFPNPTSGKIKIEVEEGGNYQLIIYTTDGKVLVSEEVVSSGNETIERNYGNLPKGNYMILLENEERGWINKLSIR